MLQRYHIPLSFGKAPLRKPATRTRLSGSRNKSEHSGDLWRLSGIQFKNHSETFLICIIPGGGLDWIPALGRNDVEICCHPWRGLSCLLGYLP